MSISYRTRQNIHHSLSIALTVIVITALVLLCLLVWLQRFIVYTDEGVVLDFDRSKDFGQSQLPEGEKNPVSVTINYSDTPYQEGLTQLNGYYIESSDLMKMKNDSQALQNLLEKLSQLPAGTPVMLDVKGYRGYFYYSTDVGKNTSSSYNISQMDALIRWLADSDLYVIARMSSLRDFDTVYQDNSYGLKKTSGITYYDQGDYGMGYWLDPTNATVQNFLIDVINELKSKGFDEVVLQNFRFPDSDDLAFQGDRNEALQQCAQKLLSSCATGDFAISFSGSDPEFQLPEGRCRLYLEDISAENAQDAWNAAMVEEKRRYLVFIAPNGDTRYDIENGILRPLQ